MPRPRKVDLLPAEVRHWLQDELKARVFTGYEELSKELNSRLEVYGLVMRIGKSAIHAYGQEFQRCVALQEQAQDEIRSFLEEASLKDEVDVTAALFQQLTAIQWRLQMTMAAPDGLPDPRGMKDLTTALNNLIRSTSLRDGILKAEHREQAALLDQAVAAGEMDRVAAGNARAILGFG